MEASSGAPPSCSSLSLVLLSSVGGSELASTEPAPASVRVVTVREPGVPPPGRDAEGRATQPARLQAVCARLCASTPASQDAAPGRNEEEAAGLLDNYLSRSTGGVG
jgi:hypothetical protein